jgi:hypothetical protein
MSIAFSKLVPGLRFWDCKKQRGGARFRGGNGWHIWPCTVLSVDQETRTARVSWNGNAASVWSEKRFKSVHFRLHRPDKAKEKKDGVVESA